MRRAADKIDLAVAQCPESAIDRVDQFRRDIETFAGEKPKLGRCQHREIRRRDQIGYRDLHCGWVTVERLPALLRGLARDITPLVTSKRATPPRITSDFDRARAGYSPDRLDALVWGLTELLVEPMPNYGIFEYTRQRAEAIRGQNSSPSQPDFTYAIGSLEWQRQQEQAGGDRS